MVGAGRRDAEFPAAGATAGRSVIGLRAEGEGVSDGAVAVQEDDRLAIAIESERGLFIQSNGEEPAG